jgi:hypothetical protein
MAVDLTRLAQDVSEELRAYVVPQRDGTEVGSPLPAEWYATGLAAMRTSLVTPYWTEMRDLDPRSGQLVILKVVVVADDGDGSLVALDPLSDGEFVLAFRDPDPDEARNIGVVSCGVRGDAVGCFLSR